jgi:competence protein ComEA
MKKASLILLSFFLMASAFIGGVFLGRHLDGSQVRISQPETTTTSTTATQNSVPETVPSDNCMVNINTATAEELATLPTIGEVIAQRIVDYRRANGPFQSLADLTAVEDIGEKRLEAILEYITIGGQP